MPALPSRADRTAARLWDAIASIDSPEFNAARAQYRRTRTVAGAYRRKVKRFARTDALISGVRVNPRNGWRVAFCVLYPPARVQEIRGY